MSTGVEHKLVMAKNCDYPHKPVTQEELYAKFLQYTLSEEQLKAWGFPYESSDGTVKSKVIFHNSANPAEQFCRCGKKVSLLEPDWFLDKQGCHYHPGKRVFEGSASGQFDCCKGNPTSRGCTFSNYHVSPFHPSEHGFVKSKTKPSQNNNRASTIFALDCEMVYTSKGLEIARVSVISVGKKLVYDTFVKPKNFILDYNTPFSGISFKNLQNVTTTLKDVQKFLLDLIDSDTILIGHGLENDLLGLNLVHKNVIDTSSVFPHENGFPFRQSLRTLALKHLGLPITKHDSVQDAKTCMQLVLLKIFSSDENNDAKQSLTPLCSFPLNLCALCLPKYYGAPLQSYAPFPVQPPVMKMFCSPIPKFFKKSKFKFSQESSSLIYYPYWPMFDVEFLPYLPHAPY